MPAGGYKAGGGRPKGSYRSTKPGAIRKRKTRTGATVENPPGLKAIPKDIRREAKKTNMTPLEYMLDVINSPEAEKERRDRLAIAAAPFVHEKVADRKVSRADEKRDAADAAATDEYAVPEAPRDRTASSKNDRRGLN